MTITLDITPEVHSELERQAAAQGKAVEAFAARLLERAIQTPGTPRSPRASSEVVEACERLKTFGRQRGLSLGGMTTRELRDEARP